MSAVLSDSLFLRSDLSPPLGQQQALLGSLHSKEQFIVQLLLYDKVLIPTNDFSVLPVLFQWFGATPILRLLSQGSLSLIRPSRLFGFTGEQRGLCTYRIQPGDAPREGWKWWMEAMHSSDVTSAASAQMSSPLVDTDPATRDRLVEAVYKSTLPYEFDSGPGSKSLFEDSYTDVQQCPLLIDEFRRLCGYPKRLPDPRNIAIQPGSLRVLSPRDFRNPVDLLLWTADLNLRVRMASLANGADLESSGNAAVVLKDKISRSQAAAAYTRGFGRLLDLNRIPDVPKLVAKGAIPFDEIIDLRDSKCAREFRTWLARAEPTDARDLERLYIESLGKIPGISSMPVRLLRFGVTTILGAIEPVSSFALSVVDSFFVEKWLSGFQPKMFLDSMRTRF